MTSPVPVTIHLEHGSYVDGLAWGNFSQPRGSEFVFCTAMSGIEESLTDPSFCGQTLIATPSHVGNTGFTQVDMESSRIWAEGLVCRHLEQIPSNWRAQKSLSEWIVEAGRYVVAGVDTRTLTVLLREQGSQRGVVSARGTFSTNTEAQQWIQKHVPPMAGLDLTGTVSCKTSYDFQASTQDEYWPLGKEISSSKSRKGSVPKTTIGVWDFGVKRNTLRLLNQSGALVKVFPAHTKAEDLLDPNIQGLLLSNGPGDPAAATQIILELKKVLGRKPIFSICLGHQLVALAAGGKTSKMKFGHRGIHHPVMELDKSGRSKKTWITSQNHGFSVEVDSVPVGAYVSFLHADDGSIEGVSYPDLRCETVQFHPEAGPGPYDTAFLIKKFVNEVTTRGNL
jgi:carbamoyl-phosphate synthase small subunit